MELTYDSKTGLLFKSKTGHATLVTSNSKPTASNLAKSDVVCGNEVESGEYFSVNMPGEYEIKGISLNAKSSENGTEIDAVGLIVDDVNVVYINPEFKYSKTVHDDLGQVDLLILEMREDNKDLPDLINKFDPEHLVLFGGEKEKVDELLKKAEIATSEETKKYKAKMDNFGGDDSILTTFVLVN